MCVNIYKFVNDVQTAQKLPFGNSTGDRQMLEYTDAGDGERMSLLVLHDDDKREYAYGPAQGHSGKYRDDFIGQVLRDVTI